MQPDGYTSIVVAVIATAHCATPAFVEEQH
jgi:hypothetical protein